MTALRVYEPLGAFPAARRPELEALAADPDAGRRVEAAERLAAWRSVLGVPFPGVLRARVLRAGDGLLLCPVALGHGSLPPEPGLPEGSADGVLPGVTSVEMSHSLVRAWELPIVWLAIVRTDDLARREELCRYVLPLSVALPRAARTLQAVREGLGEAGVTEEAEELTTWLAQFDPESWVEVDARPVAALVGGEDGADDVRLGLECLTVGDAAGVAAAYRRMSKRSHRLEELSVSS